MKKNPQLINRNGSVLTVRLDKTAPINEEEVEAAVSAGFHVLKLVSDGVSMYRVSKERDEFVRSAKDSPWSPDMCLFPFEKDRGVWRENVQHWFFRALESEEYSAQLCSTFNIDEIELKKTMVSAMNWMAHQHPRRSGGQGKRRGDLDAWLRTDRRPAIDYFKNK